MIVGAPWWQPTCCTKSSRGHLHKKNIDHLPSLIAAVDYKYGHNKPESEFLTGQLEYSWSYVRLGSCLAVERSMMKSSTLFHVFECRPLPPYVHLAPTWRHSRDRCSQAFPVFSRSSASVYYTECKPKNKKRGRPGNEASSKHFHKWRAAKDGEKPSSTR